MKNLKIFYISIIPIISFLYDVNKQVFPNTILNCNGEIPNKTACLIKASTYNIDITRIDICQEDPFPEFRTSADFNNSNCINLFNSKNLFEKLDLDKALIFKLSKEKIKDGNYKYISIILKNKFTASGKYDVGKYIYITSSKGPQEILIDKNTNKNPMKFTEKFSNWRGKANQPNRYCKNGGTFSRCDLNYNGIKLTAIGIGRDFIETHGEKTKYLFYLSEFPSPIKIDNSSIGYFEIKAKKNLEVYGNGVQVKSISIAPFLFRTDYNDS